MKNLMIKHLDNNSNLERLLNYKKSQYVKYSNLKIEYISYKLYKV